MRRAAKHFGLAGRPPRSWWLLAPLFAGLAVVTVVVGAARSSGLLGEMGAHALSAAVVVAVVVALVWRNERLLQRLALSRTFLEQAQEAAHVGSWVSGLGDGDAIEWSRETYRLFGVPDGEPITVRRFFGLVHPGDRERVQAASAAAIDTGAPYDLVHRIVRDDGSVRVIHERATVVRNDRGVPLRMVGTSVDVTESARIEERDRFLASASAELAQALGYGDTLQTVARLAVPRVADGCVLHLRADASHAPTVLAVGRGGARGNGDGDGPPPDAGRSTSVELRARGRVIGVMSLTRDHAPPFDAFARLLVRDFADRAALAIDNARLFRQEQESVRARDEFLAVASHELRTPITPLKLQVEGLVRLLERQQSHEVSMDRLASGLEVIHRSTERMHDLVEALLCASEIADGLLELDRTEVDLRQLARTVVARMRTLAEASGCSIELVASDDAVGSWDATRLERVIHALVSNAIKYGAGHPIEVAVIGGDPTRLTVRDHGAGVPAGEHERIFQRFQRGNALGGFGVGLWMAREVVSAHGGHVAVERCDDGGAAFVVELPNHSSAAASAAAGACT
jgi:PAS domain S-box-containing protein